MILRGISSEFISTSAETGNASMDGYLREVGFPLPDRNLESCAHRLLLQSRARYIVLLHSSKVLNTEEDKTFRRAIVKWGLSYAASRSLWRTNEGGFR